MLHMPFSHFTAGTHASRWGAVCVLAFAASGALAQSTFEEDFDNKEKPWKEIAVQLPAPPLDDNLVPFDVGPTMTQNYTIDAKSLSVGSDGVVRYTIVTKSPGGAKNVSYEGIRCQSKEKKLYAFGHADGSWGRSRNDNWEPIKSDRISPQQVALASDYFCRDGTVAGSTAEILDRMRKRERLWVRNVND
jgi:hypothetical protein